MSSDLAYIIAYLILLVVIAVAGQGRKNLKRFLVNERSTGGPLFLFSTVSTVVGSGAVLGVAAEASRTGISFGLITFVALAGNLLVFVLVFPRIRLAYHQTDSPSVAEFLDFKFGRLTGSCYRVVFSGVAVIWLAVQLLALGYLLVEVTGVSLFAALLLGVGIVVLYTAIGGLRADIYSDALQFLVMIAGFGMMLPNIWEIVGRAEFSSTLPQEFLSPTNFGGVPLLVGSVIIGAFYPLAQTHDWMRINAVTSTFTGRLSYLIAIPLIALFIAVAAAVGLVVFSEYPEHLGDRAFLFGVRQFAPISGLMIAAILALLMSSIDSLVLGAAVVASSLFTPIKTTGSDSTLRSLRLAILVLPMIAATLALAFPNIVQLSMLAAFISLTLGPVILFGLYNRSRSDRQAVGSVIGGLVALGIGYVVIGMNAFLAGFLVSLLIISYRKRDIG